MYETNWGEIFHVKDELRKDLYVENELGRDVYVRGKLGWDFYARNELRRNFYVKLESRIDVCPSKGIHLIVNLEYKGIIKYQGIPL